MVAFDPEAYLKQEADEIAEQFLTLKKDDLKALGKHLELMFDAKMLKDDIQTAIVNHLVSENVIEEGCVDPPVFGPTSHPELRKLALQSRIKLIRYKIALKKKYQSKSNSDLEIQIHPRLVVIHPVVISLMIVMLKNKLVCLPVLIQSKIVPPSPVRLPPSPLCRLLLVTIVRDRVMLCLSVSSCNGNMGNKVMSLNRRVL